MNAYIIIFSLNQSANLYTNFYAYLKSSGTWAIPFQGVWLVVTSSSAVQIRDGLLQKMYQGDKLLVVPTQLNNWGSYGLTKEINDWLRNKLG
jgi:hypothetical protein